VYNTIIELFYQAHAIVAQAEKRQRAFDKTVEEWKRKVTDLQAELENAQKEGRSTCAEVYKLRSDLQGTQDAIEALKRENKNLSGESECI